VLLLHSFLCSGAMWGPQVGPLAENGHRVLNMDLRGHGRSDAAARPFDLYDLVADATAVLDHAGVGRAVWAGLSIGGMIALRAALTTPERVAALVLMDTHAGGEFAARALKYRAMALVARAVGLGPLVPSVVRIFFGPETRRDKPDLVADWGRRFRDAHVPSMIATLKALNARDSLEHRLGGIGVPALVMVGADDTALPPARSRAIAEGLAEAAYREIPGAGHLSTLENPEAVNRALLDFLAGLPESQEEPQPESRPESREKPGPAAGG
jgi:pimeloyl-ACP methyl ester carboxylesterase